MAAGKRSFEEAMADYRRQRAAGRALGGWGADAGGGDGESCLNRRRRRAKETVRAWQCMHHAERNRA